MSQYAQTLDEESIHHILRALDGLRYGSVQIIVHDSKIMQIERTEKQRFPLEPNNPGCERAGKLKKP